MPECKVTPIVPVSSERPYRMALSEEEALAEPEKATGSQWDPEVVKSWSRLWQRASQSLNESLSLPSLTEPGECIDYS